jgi:hypothetical protein
VGRLFSKFVGLREDKHPHTVVKEHLGEAYKISKTPPPDSSLWVGHEFQIADTNLLLAVLEIGNEPPIYSYMPCHVDLFPLALFAEVTQNSCRKAWRFRFNGRDRQPPDHHYMTCLRCGHRSRPGEWQLSVNVASQSRRVAPAPTVWRNPTEIPPISRPRTPRFSKTA